MIPGGTNDEPDLRNWGARRAPLSRPARRQARPRHETRALHLLWNGQVGLDPGVRADVGHPPGRRRAPAAPGRRRRSPRRADQLPPGDHQRPPAPDAA
ncbi:hypothetical protein ATO5_03420 [Loktanella sp. 22II-4b]|nr:hypothetical protein ATO5_03420 [Loktanella sp. 22II-4b]